MHKNLLTNDSNNFNYDTKASDFDTPFYVILPHFLNPLVI